MSTRQAVLIRNQAVATILGQATLAGVNVESDRYDSVASGDMPRVIVFGHETLQGTSKAGTAPRFKASLNMEIQCLVERAQMADAVDDLDTLTGQVIEALFCDPIWVAMSEFIETAALQRQFKTEDRMVIGDGRITLTCNWNETYPPRLPTPLSEVFLTVVSGSDVVAEADITNLNT
jgi:hypothetical protein